MIYGSNFGLDRNLIRVTLRGLNGKDYPLRAFRVNDTVIKARLSGGIVGTYTVEVLKIGYGIARSTKSHLFKYELVVTSISPKVGASTGGTLLLI